MAKKNHNKVYFGIFIIFLMVSSTIGFMYGEGSETKKINGRKFVKTNSGWQTYFDEIGSYWEFSYLPNEINLDFNEVNFYSGKLNVYSTNELSGGYEERLKFIMLYKGIIVEHLDEENCDLEDQTLILSHSFENIEIIEENNCLYVNGNLNKFIDGITYKIFEVI
jgi:hypothetical protein